MKRLTLIFAIIGLSIAVLYPLIAGPVTSIAPLLLTDVTTTHNRNSFACNGSTTDFAFTFDVMGGDTSDIVVVVRDSAGAETLLIENAGYTVSATNNDYRSGPGGTVTTTDTYASGNTLVVYRAEDATQSATYQTGGRLDTNAVEDSFDKLYLLIQDLQEQLDRCQLVPVSDPTSLDMELPSSIDRASTYHFYGSDGAPALTTGLTTSTATVSTWGATLLDDADAAAGRNTLVTTLAYDVSQYADFSTAISTLGATVAELHIHSAQTVSTDETVPNTLTLVFHKGGSLAVASAKTVTINAPISAGNYIVFSGAGAVDITDHQVINTIWYAASGSGTSADPWVDALRNAVADCGGYQHYHLPKGKYEDASTVTIPDGRVTITGDGRTDTVVHYLQADGTACWSFVDSGNTLFWIHIEGIGFDGEDLATGGAIDCEDISEGTFYNLHIDNYNAAATSYGIRIAGRDGIEIEKCYIVCERPLWFMDNPNHATVHCDFIHIEDCILGCPTKTSGDAIHITADAMTNFQVSHVAIVQALNGLWFDNDTSFGQTSNWLFEDFRLEQMGTGWGVYLNPNDDVTGLTFINCTYGGLGDGFYSRNCHTLTFINSAFPVVTAKTAYDIDAEGRTVTFIGGVRSTTATHTFADELILHTTDTGSTDIGLRLYGGLEYLKMDRAIVPKQTVITYAASMTPDLNTANNFYINVTDAVAMTIANPTAVSGGQESFVIIVENSSGGVMGNITWGTRYLFDGGTAPTKPGNGKGLVAHFEYATANQYVCVGFSDDCTL